MIKYSNYNNLPIEIIIEKILNEDNCVKCGELYDQIETYSSIYENLKQFKEYNIKLNGSFTLTHSANKKCKCKFNFSKDYNKFSCNISYNLPIDKDLAPIFNENKSCIINDFYIIRVNNMFDDSDENMRNIIRTQNKTFEFFTDYIMTINQVKNHFINLIFE